MDIRKIIGINIKYYRYKMNLSQEKFCSLNNYSRAYVNELEQGKRNPSILLLNKLACSLNTTIDNLVSYNKNHIIDKKRIDERVKA